jgi:hypothetical protein
MDSVAFDLYLYFTKIFVAMSNEISVVGRRLSSGMLSHV